MIAKVAYCFLILLAGTNLCFADIYEESYGIPKEFLLGVATSAYQIEGGWNANGKGASIWDTFSHDPNTKDKMANNGDDACKSYEKWEEDIKMIKNLGVDHYRFSLSWARLFPNGKTEKEDEKGNKIDGLNPDGLNYYKNIIKKLIENDIKPMITLYHWDLPQALQDEGGWTDEKMVGYFEQYARRMFKEFGDDVKYWFTFNEPKQTCHLGYGKGSIPPAIKSEGNAEYKCAYIILKAHAAAYHAYDKDFRPTQKGQISYVFDATWYEPKTDSQADKDAAERYYEFLSGLFANPIYHPDGGFPKVVIDRISDRSKKLGKTPRLQQLTQEEIDNIKGTYDFLSFNTYTTLLVSAKEYDDKVETMDADAGVETSTKPSWAVQPATKWPVVPEVIRKQLNYMHNKYNKPKIMITENGFSDTSETLEDDARIEYIKKYLVNILLAKNEDKVDVIGYTAWSLMDNLEWNYGYAFKFGLYHVDFKDEERKRTIRKSGEYYKEIIETRLINGGDSIYKLLTLPLIVTVYIFQRIFN